MARTRSQAADSFSGIDDRFRAIFDAVKDGIFITEPSTGRFIEINRPGCVLFGYDKDELIGRDIALLASGNHPFTQDVAIAYGERVKAEGAETFEWQCRKKNGTLFWTEISLSYSEIGGIAAIIAVIRDISERKHQEKALHIAHHEMAVAHATKSSFLANMSHELRTPLNAIIGFSSLMKAQMIGPLDQPRYLEYAGDIHKSGLHLLELINDVLDLARLDAGKTDLSDEDVDLQDMISDICRMTEAQGMPDGLRLSNGVGDIPHVRGDARRIRQIMLNLLSNAMKFSPDGGVISFAAAETAEGLCLKFADTGIGIARENMTSVLERFGQVDTGYTRKYEGSGLGLPLSKQLIELHGGSLTIASALGQGTCVSLTFPAERLIRPAGAHGL